MLLVTAYWRTNWTLRQLASLFGVSKSAADRVIDHLGPLLSLRGDLMVAGRYQSAVHDKDGVLAKPLTG
ncbi:hypothetical protein GCM10009730_59070 [Streptomyces albidochromogenes]